MNDNKIAIVFGKEKENIQLAQWRISGALMSHHFHHSKFITAARLRILFAKRWQEKWATVSDHKMDRDLMAI